MGPQRRLPARHARLIAVLLLVASCSSDDDDPAAAATTAGAPCSTVGAGEARVDIGDRWYLRHVPPQHDGTAALPLVVDLHGYSEGAALHTIATELGAHGDDEGFVTVTPHALGEPPAWDLDVDGDDVAFVEDVIDDVEATLCIDAARVYVTGHSMGGYLISSLACSDLAARVAAFAPVAGVRLVEPCAPPRHAPTLVVHGTDDGTILYAGGLNELAAELLALPEDGPSIPKIVDAWAARDPEVDVTLHTVDGGGHEWPSEATDLIWRFFENHPLTRSPIAG